MGQGRQGEDRQGRQVRRCRLPGTTKRKYRVRVRSAAPSLHGQPVAAAPPAELASRAVGSAAGRHARVSEPDEPEALPGLRQTVRASRAVSAKRKAAKTAAAEPAAVDPVARVLVDVPLAHLDRTVRLPGAGGDGRRRGARDPGEGAVRRAGGGRLPARPRQRVRPPRAAHPAAPGRQRRAGAHARRGGAGRRRGGPLRRHAQRRAASRRAAAARRHRARRAGPGRRPTAVRRGRGGRRVGASTRRPGRSCAGWPRGSRRGPSGRPHRGRTGRRCSPTRPRRRTPARDAASCCACPTPRTWPASTPR